MDPLTEDDALQEAQLLDVRFDPLIVRSLAADGIPVPYPLYPEQGGLISWAPPSMARFSTGGPMMTTLIAGP